MPTHQLQVAIVRHISECDVEEIPGMRMSYDQAVAELREVARVAPKRLDEFELVYVNPDGTLGRYASWALDPPSRRPVTVTFAGRLPS